MRVVVATGNAGKVREIREALGGLGWQLEGLNGFPLPEETGSTYEENAALKACSVAMTTRAVALADELHAGRPLDEAATRQAIHSVRP